MAPRCARSIHRRCAGRLSLLFVLVGFAPSGIHAQSKLRILAPDGSPVQAARVEVYGKGALLDVLVSDVDGEVELAWEDWPTLRRISVSHLGFDPVLVQADDLLMMASLKLSPAPVAIDGVSVSVDGDLCPLTPSAIARERWEEVAGQYSSDTRRQTLATRYRHAAGRAMQGEMRRTKGASFLTVADARPTRVWRRVEGTAGPLESFVEEDGYSWTPARFRWSQRELNHAYPSFELWQTYHFSTPEFGDLHDFAILFEDDRTMRIAFCPNGRGSGTELMGTLDLLPGDRFVSAEWRFITDDPNEDAGGEVRFAAPEPGRVNLPHLLAAQGIFFRHNGKDPPYPDSPRSYHRELYVDIEWRPVRSATGSR